MSTMLQRKATLAVTYKQWKLILMGVKIKKPLLGEKEEQWIWAELGSWVYMIKTLYSIIKELIIYIFLIGASPNSLLQL